MKEKETVEIISKEDVERLIESINKTEKDHAELVKDEVDFNKVREVIAGLEGHTVSTVVAILAAPMLLLPTGAIASVLDMGRSVLRARAIGLLTEMAHKYKGDCNSSECPTACDEASKE